MFRKFFLLGFLVLFASFQLTDYAFGQRRARTVKRIRKLYEDRVEYEEYKKHREKLLEAFRYRKPSEKEKRRQRMLIYHDAIDSKLKVKLPDLVQSFIIKSPLIPAFEEGSKVDGTRTRRRQSQKIKNRQKTERVLSSYKPEENLLVDMLQARERPSNEIQLRKHSFNGRDIIHVYDAKRGFLIDWDFNIYTKNSKESLIGAKGDNQQILEYLYFIDDASKMECHVIDKGIDPNYVRLVTSKDALNKLKNSITEIEESAKQIYPAQVMLMHFESIADINIVKFCHAGGKPTYRIFPEKTETSKWIREEIAAHDLKQNTNEWLIQDSGLLSRKQFRNLLPNKNITFKKDIKRGIRNYQILNDPNIKVAKNQVRVFNFLPKDKKQVEKIGLKWDSENLESVKRFWSLLQNNLDKTQILTLELNEKPGFISRIFGKKDKKVYKKEILDRWAAGSEERTVDIVISVAHGTKGYFHVPSGERISRSDIQNMPENALRNKFIIDLACFGGLEQSNESRADAFLDKGAFGVVTPDLQIPVWKVYKALQDFFNLWSNNQKVPIVKVKHLFDNISELFLRVEVKGEKLVNKIG